MMQQRKLQNGLISLLGLFISAGVCAGTMGPVANKAWRPILTLTGGPAFTSDAGANAYFPATDTLFSFFNYNTNGSTQTQGVLGAFVGAEFLVKPEWFFQAGVSYYQTSYFHAKGVVTQGVDVVTQNQYSYKYQIVPHQLLAEGKLLYSYKQRYHPYLSGGIGASWNDASQFSVAIVPPFTTFSNQFTNNTTTAFSYLVGVGVDVDIAKNARLGLGYRFTDFGKAQTGPATIDTVSTTYSLSQSHLYVNMLVAQLTFEFM